MMIARVEIQNKLLFKLSILRHVYTVEIHCLYDMDFIICVGVR